MVYLICGFLVFGYFFYSMYIDGYEGIISSLIFSSIIGICGFFMSIVFFSLIGTMIGQSCNYIEYKQISSYDLQPLYEDNYLVVCYEGKSQTPVYNYLYQEESQGSLTFGSISKKRKIDIVFTELTTPKIILYRGFYTNYFFKKLFYVPVKSDKYEIYLPEGTIHYGSK